MTSTIAIALLWALPCAAQQAELSPVAIDTAVETDQAVDQNGNTATGVILDSVISVHLGRHLDAVTRPFAQRLSNTGEWNRQIWVAEVRYERPGRVGVRVDGGLIPSPVG